MASTAGVHSPPQQPSYASPPPAAPSQYAAYLSGAQQQLYQQAAANVRPGTLPPGVCVKIGEHEVTIERFLSEGKLIYLFQYPRFYCADDDDFGILSLGIDVHFDHPLIIPLDGLTRI